MAGLLTGAAAWLTQHPAARAFATSLQAGGMMSIPPRGRWSREWVLILAGLAIILVELINAEIRGASFHYEFLMLAAGLCGVGITTWGDRK